MNLTVSCNLDTSCCSTNLHSHLCNMDIPWIALNTQSCHKPHNKAVSEQKVMLVVFSLATLRYFIIYGHFCWTLDTFQFRYLLPMKLDASYRGNHARRVGIAAMKVSGRSYKNRCRTTQIGKGWFVIDRLWYDIPKKICEDSVSVLFGYV